MTDNGTLICRYLAGCRPHNLFVGITRLQIWTAVALVVASGFIFWSERQITLKLRAENAALLALTAGASREDPRSEIDAQKNTILGQEVSSLAALRAEEAQLKRSIADAAAVRRVQLSAPGQKFHQSILFQGLRQSIDGEPVYSSKEVQVQPFLLERVRPEYPIGMKLAGVEGEIFLYVIIGADGTVKEMEIKHATSDVFAEAAKKAVEKWKFTPAKRRGVAVNALVTLPVFFLVDDRWKIPDWF